ncbi:MAG: multicopper oxidase family protein [Cyanobacteria bacterium P01_G01_bin.38]
MQLSRRNALKLGLIGSGQMMFSQSALASCQNPTFPVKPDCPPARHHGEPLASPFPMTTTPSPAVPKFRRPFELPPVLQPVRSDERGARPTDYYELTLQKSQTEIMTGKPTEVWSYNGVTPGPTIRQKGGLEPADQGRQSVVRFVNQLGGDATGRPIKSSTHLHGMASQPYYDGYAEDLIAPNYFKDYVYPNDRAATIWYHDHAVEETSRNVYRGLAGMYIVEDEIERRLNLPSGRYDVPLVLQDVRLDRDGQLVFNDRARRNLYGDVTLVNGVPWPHMQVERRKYRFRVLNASVSRSYRLTLSQFEDRQTFDDTLSVIATDCGILGAPVPIRATPRRPFKSFRISPAERYEFVIDFSQYAPGTELYLRSPALQSNIDSEVRSQALMRFEVMPGSPDDPSELRPVLRPVTSLLETAQKQGKSICTRTFRFERSATQWLINNKVWNPYRVDANPQPGDVEIWELVNSGGGWIHPVHIHLVDSQIISRNGLPAYDYEQGWKDVFAVREFESVRVIMQFESRNKQPIEGRFMMHCHNLVHEDHDMMTQFEVGSRGEDPCARPPQSVAGMLPL